MMGRDAGAGSAQPGDWGTFDVAVVILLAVLVCVNKNHEMFYVTGRKLVLWLAKDLIWLHFHTNF